MTTKLLQLFAFLAIMTVAVGVVAVPNNPIFWLATQSGVYQLARLAVAAVLLTQFITEPPRHLLFRVAAAAFGVFIAVWAVQQFYAYHMQPLDLLAFLGAACAMVETSLERRVEESLPLLILPRLLTLKK